LRYGWGLKKLRSLMYPRADLIVAQTTEIEASLRSLMAPVVTIPNAVECAKKHAVYPDPIVSVVSVGRLTEQKDFPTLLKAFCKTHGQAPHCKLYIYGEGPDRAALQDFIAAFHLEKHIFLPGVVKDMPTVLSEAGIFVSSTRYEGFPNTLAEAMAVGVPVISSDRPENKALISDGVNGRLFPVGDADRLAELMAELMMDFEQRKRLGQEATKITQRFSLERNHTLWQEAIERVIVGRSKG
jgi:glycosyltransferase involved in cell wall biosynthesis